MTRNRYDCSQCPGFCCSYSRIAISDHDIKRLAKHFDLPFEQARDKFTYHYTADGCDERVLRHHKDHIFKSVCMFLDQKKRCCTVYEARPSLCKVYPYGARCGYYQFLKFERTLQDDKKYIALTGE